MIRSMTGYGEAAGEYDGVHYFLELRSLNGKYFKAIVRLPDDLQGLEAELEPRLRRRLNRGSIVLTARCANVSASAAHTINTGALSRYLEQISQTPGFDCSGVRIDAAGLLSLPGVLQPPTDDEDRVLHAGAALNDLLDLACERMISSREREGSLLVRDLDGLLDTIDDRLKVVAERAPLVVDEYMHRLRSRIDSLLADVKVQVDQKDLVREVAVYAEKTDIAEEVSRLTGHLGQFRELIGPDRAEPVGRTLDFLSQEMLREANTMASKSNDAEISRAVVEIKGAIDRIKEQVQNVE